MKFSNLFIHLAIYLMIILYISPCALGSWSDYATEETRHEEYSEIAKNFTKDDYRQACLCVDTYLRNLLTGNYIGAYDCKYPDYGEACSLLIGAESIDGNGLLAHESIGEMNFDIAQQTSLPYGEVIGGYIGPQVTYKIVAAEPYDTLKGRQTTVYSSPIKYRAQSVSRDTVIKHDIDNGIRVKTLIYIGDNHVEEQIAYLAKINNQWKMCLISIAFGEFVGVEGYLYESDSLNTVSSHPITSSSSKKTAEHNPLAATGYGFLGLLAYNLLKAAKKSTDTLKLIEFTHRLVSYIEDNPRGFSKLLAICKKFGILTIGLPFLEAEYDCRVNETPKIMRYAWATLEFAAPLIIGAVVFATAPASAPVGLIACGLGFVGSLILDNVKNMLF